MLFFRLAKFLELPVLPLFVLDGPNRPKWKRGKLVRGRQHLLTGSFKSMVRAFGFEWHQAPGEAEAELAYLNRIGEIDAVLSDDVDNFLFGATLVIRNPSATLSGNKGHSMKNADGREDGQHVMLFSSQAIQEHPAIGLSHAGFILIGLMNGGDYDTSGLSRCGIKISHALARAGLGDSLYTLYNAHHSNPRALSAALAEWREGLKLYLSTDPENLIGKKMRSLANSIPSTWPDPEILKYYVHPVTSERGGTVPTFDWGRPVDLVAIANQCEMHYEWGVKTIILKRFARCIWPGLVFRILRASVMKRDRREQERQMDRSWTPGNTRGERNLATGSPSKLVARTLSRLDLSSDSEELTNQGNPFSENYEPERELVIKIHLSRQHASTDGTLEYRVEADPSQFVDIVEGGLKGLRSEDSIDVINFGKRRKFDDEFNDADDGQEEEDGGKNRPRERVRVWIPAVIMKLVHPELVEEFEKKEVMKAKKRMEKEQRAKDRAEGRSPTKMSKRGRKKGVVLSPSNAPGDSAEDVSAQSPMGPASLNRGVGDENDDNETPRPMKSTRKVNSTSTVSATGDGDLLSTLKSISIASPKRATRSRTIETHASIPASKTLNYLSETEECISTDSTTITDNQNGTKTSISVQDILLPASSASSLPSSLQQRARMLLEGMESSPPSPCTPLGTTSPDASPTRNLKESTFCQLSRPVTSGSIRPSSTSSLDLTSASTSDMNKRFARRLLFSQPSDIHSHHSEEDDELDPYELLRKESGSSRATSGTSLVEKNGRDSKVMGGRWKTSIGMNKSLNGRRKGQRSVVEEEEMEDFSHIFGSEIPQSTQRLRSSELIESSNRNRFVVESDEEEPIGRAARREDANPREKVTTRRPALDNISAQSIFGNTAYISSTKSPSRIQPSFSSSQPNSSILPPSLQHALDDTPVKRLQSKPMKRSEVIELSSDEEGGNSVSVTLRDSREESFSLLGNRPPQTPGQRPGVCRRAPVGKIIDFIELDD